jgi:hypothetical protein
MTTKAYEWKATGDANCYLITGKNKWVAQVRLNGEMTVPLQEDVMKTVVDEMNRFHDFVSDPLRIKQ